MYRRRKSILIYVFMLTALLSSCSPQVVSEEKETERLQVVTSVYPVYSLTREVAEGLADVSVLMPTSGDAHHWEPSPQDMQRLTAADVFIYNGAGLEGWVDDVLNSLANEDLVVVEASAGVDLIEAEDEGHGADPHVWTDPVNAVIMNDNITTALVAADPAQSQAYQANHARFGAELEQLAADYQQELAPFAGRTILLAHEAFGYLAQRHDLHQEGLTGLMDEGEPSPQRIAELAEQAASAGVRTIFVEPMKERSAALTLAAEIGGEVAILDPFAMQADERMEDPGAPGSYVETGRRNLETLVAALTIEEP